MLLLTLLLILILCAETSGFAGSIRTGPTSAGASRRPTTQQLQWIAAGVEKLLSNHTHYDEKDDDAEILDAVYELCQARTPQQITHVGRRLQALDLTSQPVAVQERIAKATAITGLLYIALNITDHLMKDLSLSPSEMCQAAICASLRKRGKVRTLERFLTDVGKVSRNHPNENEKIETAARGVSLYSFNLLLAAFTDPIVDTTESRTFFAPVDKRAMLQKAIDYVVQPNMTQAVLGVAPDSVSHATVLNAVTKIGDASMIHELWDAAERQQVPKDTSLVNARLKSCGDDDEKALQLWEDVSKYVKPDRYTVALLLGPLMRAGWVGQVETLLDTMLVSMSQESISQAFESYLYALVQSGDVASARALFESYVKPSLSPVIVSSNSASGRMILRLVKPSVRHFNILLQGYKQQIADESELLLTKNSQSFDHDDGQDKIEELCREASDLYEVLRLAPNLQPDAYTFTIFMGICRSVPELTNLLGQAQDEFQLDCFSSALLRSAMTRYGELGDPASACRLFANYASEREQHESKDQQPSIRYWNVLLGALANNPTTRLNISSAHVTRATNNSADGNPEFSVSDSVFASIDGLQCWEAVQLLLHRNIQAPNSQTFCIAAKALQFSSSESTTSALELFRKALDVGIGADGRFVNAILRCFGSDIDGAIQAWKTELRRACLAHETRTRATPPSAARVKGKNLVAAYHGLLYVCGRALRPEMALRVVYAMVKTEGLAADETALNCYNAGKRYSTTKNKELELQSLSSDSRRVRLTKKISKMLQMNAAYESLLEVECLQYNSKDKRRRGEKRVKIIL